MFENANRLVAGDRWEILKELIEGNAGLKVFEQ